MSSEDFDESDSILEINIPNPQSRIQEYNDLSSKVGRIHSSFLFYRDKIQTDSVPQLCLKIFTTLVKRIGGTKENYNSLGWKDLGYHLGIGGEDLNYIENSMKTCPTETILRVFCQDEFATFDKIIQVLLSVQRLDAIEGIFDALQHLTELLIENHENDIDQGYYSNKSKEDELSIIKPANFLNNLPEVLRKNEKKNIKNDPVHSDEMKMPSISEPSILLTYFEDGLQLAHKIYHILNNHTVNGKSIKVILLENEKSSILINPEHYIRHYFEKVNYVIPILSEGYFKVIKSTSSICASSLDNVDCTYARFIYTLMSSHYINGTGCLNKKVRGVLPQNISQKVVADLYKYPILSVWIREDQLNKLMTLLF